MTNVSIVSPCDGDVVNRNDGVEGADALRITVRGQALDTPTVVVNGIPAAVEGGQFACEVSLAKRRNEIVAQAGEAREIVEVWWNRGSRARYRFSVDDNIQFLKDLAANPEAYPSLFDHWYLAFWREMHVTYGAKIHLNIYYQTDGFDLSEMPELWRDEWRENAAWLHLSFHALQDKPDRPYRNANYAQMAHDFDLVCGHIRRFAGNEVLSQTTTVHWAECPKSAALALRDRGIEQLVGLFEGHQGGHTTGYYFSPTQCRYIDERPAWHDRDTGVFFIPCTMVVNAFEVEAIASRLDERAASPHRAEMVELLIHEQYFRRDLPQYYQPRALDKVRTALDWVARRNCDPVFWSDGFLGV